LAISHPRGDWTPLTLELLGDASVLAQRFSGRVGAWVLNGPGDLVQLANHGCDVIFHLRHERLARWCSEVVAAALAEAVSPNCRVILLPGGARGEEVAALLAQRLGTAWIADALTLSVTRSDVLEITALQPGGKLSRVHRPRSERPVVITMRPGVAE